MKRIKWWELALCVSLMGALAVDLRAYYQQQDIADKVVRLHVLANSDSQADQALKLQVKDRVYALTEELLVLSPDRREAVAALEQALPRLEAAARQTVAEAGYTYPVTVALENSSFPTKSYEGFSLPAGEYLALRVIIGAGDGRNWWCVVFPPLCAASVTDWEAAAMEGGLSEKEITLIAEEEGYVLKSKAIELWETAKVKWDAFTE